jgi:hypothetical protein
MVKSFEVPVHGFHKEQKGKESDCLGVDIAKLFFFVAVGRTK